MLRFENVTKEYPGNIVSLKDITVDIPDGQFVFITGPSGAGKTTLVKLLIREGLPTTGRIFFGDTEITALSGRQLPFWRRQVGVVFQDYRLLPLQTAFENIALALRVIGKKSSEIKTLVPSLLKLVGLAGRESAFPSQLSGGEKQRLAIARAISHNPRVLIADEPTGNIDQANSWEIMKLLMDINQWGTTVVVATHDERIVKALKKRTLVLNGGMINSDSEQT